MAVEKVELVHKWSHKRLQMGIARIKEDKEAEVEGMQKRVKMKRSKVGAK